MTHKKLVLVVHGIGEQKSGETINQLVGTITNRHAAKVKQDIKWLPDNHDNLRQRQVESFPCHTRRITLDETEVVVAEVFWADLSRAVTSRLRTLLDLVQTVLGVGYAVRENALEKRPNNDWIRKITFTFVEIMHGPILVSNIVNALVLMCLFGLNWLNDHHYLSFFIERSHKPIFLTTLILTAALIFLFLMYWATLAIGLGVAKDIIGYFSLETLPNAKQMHSTKGATPARRARINGRLQQVFEQFWEAEKPDEVVVITHSQGTIVAMETIRDGI